MTVRTYQPGADVLPASGAAPVSTPQGWEAHPQGAARPRPRILVRRQTAYPASTPAASSSSPGYQRRLLRKARTPVRPNEAAEQPFAVAAPTVTALPEGWQSEPAPRQRVSRTLARDEQTLLKTPPLAPPFPEGWYSERAIIRPAARTTPHDEPSSGTLLSLPPLAPAFREGWYAERFILRPLARTTPHDEQSSGTLLSTPPLAPAFKEGWQSDRFILQSLTRTLTHEEPASGTILKVPPLAPAFPEGWQAQSILPAKPSRALALDVPLYLRLVVAPLSFPDGWQAARAIVPLLPVVRRRRQAPAIQTTPVASSSAPGYARRLLRRPLPIRRYDDHFLAPVAAPPAASPQGWDALRAVQIPLPWLEVGGDLTAVAELPPYPEGWYAERTPLVAVCRSLVHDEQTAQTILRVPPLAVFREGWQAHDRRPGQPARALAFDIPLLFKFVPIPLAFPEGWQSERYRLPPAPLRQLADLAPAAAIILKVPPLAPPFKEGWQSSEIRPGQPARTFTSEASLILRFLAIPPRIEGWQAERTLSFLLRRRQPVESELILPAVPLPFLLGWQAERCRLYALAHSLTHDEQVILRVPPLAPPFPEGWQAQEAWNRSLWKFLRPAVLSAFYDVLFPSTKAFRVISLQGNYLPAHALSGTNLPSKNLTGTNIPSKNLSGTNLPSKNLSGTNIPSKNLSGD